ncbi:response regulator transcription factor [Nostocales cyanobacterium LEGE 11386]|nr:response regulator transcription factor [Nostocales cyanobacterium LEGE 11386]
MIRIVVIEDQPLIRMGIQKALAEDPNIELCGEAESGEKGCLLVEKMQPDIVLVDIGLPDVSGLDVTVAIKEKNCHIKVIIITCESSKYVVNSAFKNGADSYLLKQDVGIIKYAIEKTHAGETFLDPKITKNFIEQKNSKKGLRKGKLYEAEPTETEIEILKLIACGLSNKEIANKLFITTNTVKSHINSLFSKLKTRNRVEAVTEGQKLGYVKSCDIHHGLTDEEMRNWKLSNFN